MGAAIVAAQSPEATSPTLGLTELTCACTVRRLDGGYISDGLACRTAPDGTLTVWNLTEPGALLLEYYGRTVRECLLSVGLAAPRRVQLLAAVWTSSGGRRFTFRPV